ncbi:MAG: endonuclease MutS2 [Gemmatimonadetes bacterium]|nr:endonuclease MutS2 [Gemmatimonadota bacterium]
MNAHALAVLEFERVLALVAERAPSELGGARVRALRPRSDRTWLEAEHARVAAMRALHAHETGWTAHRIPDLAAALTRLRLEGTTWSALDLLGGATLLAASRKTADQLREEKRPAAARAVLAHLAAQLVRLPREEEAITRIIGDDGAVRDDASPALRRIRRELRGAEADLVRILERVVQGLPEHQRVLDASVTVRNGRYVIPVRREARGTVGGIVHDTSGSGATLFVEPPAAVEFGNRIRELEGDEVEEVERILREATDRLRPFHGELVAAFDALVELESLSARARWALDVGAAAADFAEPGGAVRIIEGRHPLLVAQGVEVVPFDLALDERQRTLLLSGPNTGGKTVLLKAIGLIVALLQSGVPAPLGAGSLVPLVDDIFADVGDEQSIAASLSTFSAHLKNVAEILAHATFASLVLTDELGSGTDPQEGGALGAAVLEALTARGVLTVATTHLGSLKELATEVPGIVNASLQFDAERLAPTYRLIVGVPGRSYGLGIARRLGLPEAVLARAEERLPRAERDYEALLADLERRSAELETLERDARELRENAAERVGRLSELEAELKKRERSAERDARDQARRYLLEARAEVEAAVRAVKQAQGEAIEAAAREARRTVERKAGEAGERVQALERAQAEAARAEAGQGGPVRQGDTVSVATLGGKLGRVLELRADDAVVSVGSLRLTVPLSTLSRSNQQLPAEPLVPLRGDLPEPVAKREIDVRGMRAAEVEDLVLQAVDAAVHADLKAIRIIHGKGTGALRERVAEMLAKDTRVSSFRMGAWNEGGAGVTVAEFA